MQSRRSSAEVELLRDGEEITKQARLKFDSPRLSLAHREGLADACRKAGLPVIHVWDVVETARRD